LNGSPTLFNGNKNLSYLHEEMNSLANSNKLALKMQNEGILMTEELESQGKLIWVIILLIKNRVLSGKLTIFLPKLVLLIPLLNF
jgi:hypothetical protein